MKNNKGFSLVELIIVIAIMAILVGVMAPQLIKYIEKTNVSSDTQLASTVQTAITTAVMDPEVVKATDTTATMTSLSGGTTADAVAGASNTLGYAVSEILGTTTPSAGLKSNGHGPISVIVSSNKVTVWLPGTDSTGSKHSDTNTIAVY